MTVLLTTHYMEEADRLKLQLAIVDRGKVVVTGSPDELKRELRGDAIQVEIANAELNGARAALERLDGVRELAVDGRTVRPTDDARAVPGLLAALDSRRRGRELVTVARPSLDDASLRCRAAAGAADTDTEEATDDDPAPHRTHDRCIPAPGQLASRGG